MQSRPNDPIRTNYFDIIEKVDKAAGILFFIGAGLSIASTFIPESEYKLVSQWVQISFFVAVLGLFLLDLTAKLYLSPRAADARAQDFLSHAYGQHLSSARTTNYYNNNVALGMGKIAAQTFENTLFTKEICRRMFNKELPLVLLYIVIFAVGVANRNLSITIWCAVAQVIFSEQIVIRLIRLKWLQRRTEQIHEELRHLYLSGTSGIAFDGIAMDAYTRYETSKSTAGITLSSRIHEEVNPHLSIEWDQLRATYSIA